MMTLANAMDFVTCQREQKAVCTTPALDRTPDSLPDSKGPTQSGIRA
jgi:hypothetical protein